MLSSCQSEKIGSNQDTQQNNRVEASYVSSASLKRRFTENPADELFTGDPSHYSSKRPLLDFNSTSPQNPPNAVDIQCEKVSDLKEYPFPVRRSNSSNSNFSGACYTSEKNEEVLEDHQQRCRPRLNRSKIENLTTTATMGHASSKRSRQEPSHRVVQMSGSRNHKRYLDGYKDTVSTRMSNKGMSRNADTEIEEEEHERTQWSQKKGPPKEMAPLLRSFGGHQPRFLHASAIKLHKLQFGIDKRLTIVDEKSNAVLKYRTPHFRALATVEIPPLPAGVNIQVGWIQVCTDMQFINTYGNEGLTSWEFPEIVSGKYKMVSDADGKQYPWYGSKNEVAHMQGPTQAPTTATIHMNDNFFPQVTWYIPSIGYTRDPSLTFVYRKQRFYTFLALKDVNTDTYQIIRTLTWSMELAIDVNPKNPLGKRAKLLGPFEQESPKVVPEHLTPPLKSYALNPPNANSCQVLVWRPKYGDTELVVPPVQTTMDMSRYLTSTRDATSKLLRITKSNFLLQQQQK